MQSKTKTKATKEKQKNKTNERQTKPNQNRENIFFLFCTTQNNESTTCTSAQDAVGLSARVTRDTQGSCDVSFFECEKKQRLAHPRV